MDSLKLASIVTHVADAKTCLLHPASHTHRQMSEEQLKEAGVAPDLIRFSVGLEAAQDIINDLQQALDAMKASLLQNGKFSILFFFAYNKVYTNKGVVHICQSTYPMHCPAKDILESEKSLQIENKVHIDKEFDH